MIFIPIEITKREADAAFFLASYLSQNGYSCIVGDQEAIRPIARTISCSGDVYYDKAITDNTPRRSLYRSLSHKKSLIYTSDAEGIIMNEFDEFMALRYPEINMKIVSRIFAWGERDFDFLVDKFPAFKSKIQKSGNQRILYYVHIAGKEKRNTLTSTGKVVDGKNSHGLNYDNYRLKLLYCSNGSAGLGNCIVSEMITATANRQTGPYSSLELLRRRSEGLLQSYLTINCLIKLANAGHSITIRPHPTEKSEPFQIACNNPRINVDGRSTLQAQIQNHDLLLHRGCTTSLQASILGVPSISLDFDDKRSVSSIADSYSLVCSSCSEVIDACHQYALTRSMNIKNPICNHLFFANPSVFPQVLAKDRANKRGHSQLSILCSLIIANYVAARSFLSNQSFGKRSIRKFQAREFFTSFLASNCKGLIVSPNLCIVPALTK
jgi:hypothetical protein